MSQILFSVHVGKNNLSKYLGHCRFLCHLENIFPAAAQCLLNCTYVAVSSENKAETAFSAQLRVPIYLSVWVFFFCFIFLSELQIMFFYVRIFQVCYQEICRKHVRIAGIHLS